MVRAAARERTANYMAENLDSYPQTLPKNTLRKIITSASYLSGNHYGLTTPEARILGNKTNLKESKLTFLKSQKLSENLPGTSSHRSPS